MVACTLFVLLKRPFFFTSPAADERWMFSYWTLSSKAQLPWGIGYVARKIFATLHRKPLQYLPCSPYRNAYMHPVGPSRLVNKISLKIATHSVMVYHKNKLGWRQKMGNKHKYGSAANLTFFLCILLVKTWIISLIDDIIESPPSQLTLSSKEMISKWAFILVYSLVYSLYCECIWRT